MQSLLKVSRALAKSRMAHLGLGVITLAAGVFELAMTMEEGLFAHGLHSGHGVTLLGLWHTLRALIEIVESAELIEDGLGISGRSGAHHG